MSTHSKSSNPRVDSGGALSLQFPPLNDEAALAISDLLAAISDRFDDLYARQIQRASRARRRADSRLRREGQCLKSQQELPLA
jgi:hypothetical protein